MKKILSTLAIIILTISSQAQTADEFFKSVIEKTKSYDNISIVFNYKMINKAAGINESMPGYGSMKGDSFKINVSGQELISNGKVLWTHLVDDEEVMISDVSDGGSSSPLAIIDSFSDNVQIDFISIDNSDIKVIEVKEKDGDTFDKIQITVNSKDLKIKKIHAYGLDNNEFVYEITEFTTNQELPDDFFIFNEALHPNVEIIDMR